MNFKCEKDMVIVDDFWYAFKLYEEGHKIYSVASGNFYKKILGNDCIWDIFFKEWTENCPYFTLEEIRGEWCI